ncbi:O-antigen ligase family protein [Sphingosinicella terrae]|uniref:O-antigen ligase family protein n=1 Tax=Sphingosinicella terrae TaxID=2172047 RepID=UPI0013B470C9|nr:O-antigen ligase family protein [Sphingosinicella terrae]
MWLLVALAPFLFALASWNPSGERRIGQALALGLSLPITLIELLVIVLALASGFEIRRTLGAMPAWAKLLLATLLAVAIGTALTAVIPARAWIRTAQLAIHLLFGLSAWHLFRTRWAGLASSAWWWITIGTCLYVAMVAAWVFAVHDEPRFDWKSFGLAVGHIRQTGFYSAAGAGAALGLAAIARSRSGYALAVAAATLLVALSCWSGTRGSLFAVFAAFAAGLVFLPSMRNRRAVVALVIAHIGGALVSLLHQAPHAFYGLWRISETAAATGADELATGRLRMWAASFDAILERPLFGWGESQFLVAVPSWGQFNHPHNILVQVLVQWGMVGFMCWLVLAGWLGWRFLAAARAGGPALVPPFLVAASLATMAMYEGALYHPYPFMMVVLALAFVLASPPPIQLRGH